MHSAAQFWHLGHWHSNSQILDSVKSFDPDEGNYANWPVQAVRTRPPLQSDLAHSGCRATSTPLLRLTAHLAAHAWRCSGAAGMHEVISAAPESVSYRDIANGLQQAVPLQGKISTFPGHGLL